MLRHRQGTRSGAAAKRRIHLPAAARLLSLCAAAWLAGCGGSLGPRFDYAMKPKPNDFPRDGFGHPSLAFWMGLTAPEIRALENRDKAAAGDPAALLDLAILASGAPRDAAGYDSIHARVRAFVAGAAPAVNGEPTAYRRGLKLYQAMHAGFFPSRKPAAGSGAEVADGYEFDQSALAPIFGTRKFNCVSSAILFVILARHFGMDAQGVLLGGHAFAQIRTPEGKVIEVETTSPIGYDWVHDKEFYRKRASAFFGSRGIPATTFKDYESRAILDPLAFVAANMNNQHTAPSRMPQADRCRLAEARAMLAPADSEAQVNRLDLYNAEFAWLKRQKDFAALERMFRTVSPALTAIGRRWGVDTALSNHLAWAWYEYAQTMHELGRGVEGLAYVDSSLAHARPAEKNGAAVRDNDLALIQTVAVALAEAKEYSRAEDVIGRYPALVRDDAGFRRTRSWVYSRWAMDLWEKEDWAGAVAKFERQKETATAAEKKTAAENIAGAYINWAAGHESAGDWLKTRDVLAACVEKTAARKCRTLLDQVLAQHKLE